MSIIEQAIEKIAEKQKQYNEEQKHYWIAEQVKDIASENEFNAEHIEHDLDDDKMSIAAIEKKIKAYAEKHGGCTPPKAADNIIREFFGLPKADETPKQKPQAAADILNLEDFL